MSTYKVYNFYPKLYDKMETWHQHLDSIKNMGFNYIYINPISYLGGSNSDYAISDYFSYNPNYIYGYHTENSEKLRQDGERLFGDFCQQAKKRGLHVLIDIVINHTAIDSSLVSEKPNWYKKDELGNIVIPGVFDRDTWVSWEDLADIDNENSTEKEELWNYWLSVFEYFVSLGVDGFRCDAAYMVPATLWTYIIDNIKTKHPSVLFIGETLGCTMNQTISSYKAGFDMIMNSLKWWDYKALNHIHEYNDLIKETKTLTFPENHDTNRYADEVDGNASLICLKYGLSALLSKGVAITTGFEYGFRRKINVFKTNSTWWENTGQDFRNEILFYNTVKDQHLIFQDDFPFQIIRTRSKHVLILYKENANSKERAYIIANIDGQSYRQASLSLRADISEVFIQYRNYKKTTIEAKNHTFRLKPGELIVLVGEVKL